MNKEKSIEVISQALEVANRKGSFSLTEAVIINQALGFLKMKEPEAPKPAEPAEPSE